MRRLAAVLVLSTLALAGCATYRWYKPGLTEEQLAGDDSDCWRQSRELARWRVLQAGPVIPGRGTSADWSWELSEQQRIYTQCMQARGYELLEQEARG